MSKYDEQYLDLVERILKDGYYDQNRTGIATYKLPHQILRFDLQEEKMGGLPPLFSKHNRCLVC